MKKPKSHVIDEDGCNLFRRTLRGDDWLIYGLDNDYGTDFIVEMLNNGSTTGLQLNAQLKSTRSPDYRGGQIRVRLKRKHVEEFSNSKNPFFLFIADVVSNKLYWEFLQEYFDSLEGNVQLEPSTQVNIPITQEIGDMTAFKAAVQAAARYMRIKNRPALAEALQAEVSDLKKLDPRFEIELHTGPDGNRFVLKPNEHVSTTIKFQSSDPELYENLIGRGLPVALEKGILSVEGSKLMEHLLIGATKIEIAKKMVGTLGAFELLETGEKVCRMLPIHCRIEGGRSEVRLVADFPKGMGQILGTFHHDVSQGGTFQIKPTCDKWLDQSLIEATFFDEINFLLLSDKQRELTFFQDGIETFSIGLRKPVDPSRQLLGFISVFGKMRAIAKFFKLNVQLPKSLTREQVKQMEILALASGYRTLAETDGGTVGVFLR